MLLRKLIEKVFFFFFQREIAESNDTESVVRSKIHYFFDVVMIVVQVENFYVSANNFEMFAETQTLSSI